MKTDSHLPQFADLMSEYVNFISGIGKCDYITRIYLNSFAKYCMNHGGVLSDDIISGWASRTDKESYYTNRNRCIILSVISGRNMGHRSNCHHILRT